MKAMTNIMDQKLNAKAMRFLLYGSLFECILFFCAVIISFVCNTAYSNMIDAEYETKEALILLNERTDHLKQCIKSYRENRNEQEDYEFEVYTDGTEINRILSSKIAYQTSGIEEFVSLCREIAGITNISSFLGSDHVADSLLDKYDKLLTSSNLYSSYRKACEDIEFAISWNKSLLDSLKMAYVIVICLSLPLFLMTIFVSYKKIDKDTSSIIQKSRKESYTDALTGLWNRKYTEKEVEDDILKGVTDSFLFMMDMDNFKSVNDTYGHITGDNILKCFANVLRHNSRENDICCRIGGDEFILYVRNCTKEHAEQIAKRILKNASESLSKIEGGANVTLSIGISKMQKDILSFKDLFDRADEGLYKIKKTGKNNYIFA